MAGRPPAGATFEVERVGGGRKRARGSFAAVAWVGAIAVMISFAVLGRGADAPQPRGLAEGSGAPATSTATDAAVAPAAADLGAFDPIDLRSPAVGPITVTTPKLLIAGTMQVRADHVEIALEARNNRVIDHASVDVTDPNGGLRRDHQAQFEVSFDIPNPRPNDTMWVVVTAYDSHGIPLGGDRRPFNVGPIVMTDMVEAPPFDFVDAPPLDQKRCGPDISGWRCG